jgi:PAS domain S-box-containing protein
MSDTAAQSTKNANRMVAPTLLPLLFGLFSLITIVGAGVSSAKTQVAQSSAWYSLAAWSLVTGTGLAIAFRCTMLIPLRKFQDKLEHSGALRNSSLSWSGVHNALSGLLRKLDEAKGRESTIAEASKDILCCLDEESRILIAGGAAEKQLGFLQQELVGKMLPALAFSEDLRKLETALSRAHSSKQPVTVDVRMATASREAIDLRWTIEWSQTETCFFACAENITDQKMLERARRDFVAMISHDIKLPLGAAMLNIESVEAGLYGEVSKDGTDALLRAQSSLHRLMGLLEELLEFEKLSAGKMELSLQECSLDELVEHSLAESLESARNKKVTLEHQTSKLFIKVDRYKILRVLQNLISNAIKHAPPQSNVIIRTQGKPTFAEITVTDSGPGVPPEYSRLVFERYERLTTQQAENEGTGLGLAIAKAIVEAHGGAIGVTSPPEGGSTFWFTLPS